MRIGRRLQVHVGRTMDAPRGFTLVELLVVIAILSLALRPPRSGMSRRDIGDVHVGPHPAPMPGPAARAAMLEDLRRPMIAGDQDVGKRLVVAQQNVEARPQPLDQVGLEQQRLGLGLGRDEFERRGGGGSGSSDWRGSGPAG